jgi:xanthine dehydrogenase molybdenum-binding subunit
MSADFAENKPWLLRPPANGYIGKRGLRPKEAPEKVTGRAIYTSDIYLPGMLYVKIFRSPYAHARIKSMDSRKAEALPGVWAVIRYDDPQIDFSDPYKPMLGHTWFWYRDSILPDTADFHAVRMGALVVAESEEICDEALRLIAEGIEWQQLPIVLDPKEAAKPDAPLMHPELNAKSNVWKDIVIYNIGDVEKGFEASDHVVEFDEYKMYDDIWAGVEPGCMVARWMGEDLEVWYHGQFVAWDVPFMMASAYKNDAVKPSKLKVHTPYNGGTFGGNTMGLAAQLLRYTVIAARKTLRPVKLVDDYAMSWEGTSFEVGTAHYKVGYNNDGNIVAIRIDVHQKSGIPIVEKFKDSLKTPNILVHEIHSYWTRGHESCWKDGAANCTFINLIINKVAAKLQMDPIDVQLINDGADGHDMAWLDEHIKKPNGLPSRDSLKEVVEAGKKAFEWDKKWHAPGTCKLPNGKMHGVGFYAVNSWQSVLRKCAAPGISVGPDGTATIFYRRPDCGQSAPTTYCQVVADEIGLRYEDVKIEFIEYFSFDANFPAGSLGSSLNTYGLVVNSRKMKKLLLEYAVKPPPPPLRARDAVPAAPYPFKDKKIEELDIRDGLVFEKANPKNSMPVKRITASHSGGMFSQSGPFFVGDWIPELAHVDEPIPLARQCLFIEVEVDTETGQVDITKLVHPYDTGMSINPNVNEQQLYGGAYQGLGVSSTEAIYYDPQTGVKLNDNLIGYPVLTILDVGPIETPIVETHLGWTTYGMFACSEAGKATTAAALLVPAVYNATGVWIEDTPVTPDKVLKALGKA